MISFKKDSNTTSKSCFGMWHLLHTRINMKKSNLNIYEILKHQSDDLIMQADVILFLEYTSCHCLLPFFNQAGIYQSHFFRIREDYQQLWHLFQVFVVSRHSPGSFYDGAIIFLLHNNFYWDFVPVLMGAFRSLIA